MNNQNNNGSFSGLQFSILIAIGCVFIALIWGMIPISPILKFMLLFLGGFALLYVVFLFAENLKYYRCGVSKWSAILLTALLFLLIPGILHLEYMSHKETYLSAPPTNGVIYTKIEADVKMIEMSGSVGDEWSYKHFFNNSPFISRDIIAIGFDKPFSITSRIIENDSISDVGETISKTYRFSNSNNYIKGITIAQNVKVVENGGRRYAGSYATCKVNYSLERVIPPDMGFYGLVLYTNDRYEYAFSVSLIVAEIFCLIIIMFITLGGSVRKKKMEEQFREERLMEEKFRNESIREQERLHREKEKEVQEKLREEQQRQLLEEKTNFINALNGRSIREVASVPTHIRYVNGLPIDNNDSMYGSFTVYISKNGECYHEKSGCCSAGIPIHVIKARNRYRKCSKCCRTYYPFPKWHYDYISLLQKARKYGINE